MHVEEKDSGNPVNQKVADYINTGVYGIKTKGPSPESKQGPGKGILKQPN